MSRPEEPNDAGEPRDRDLDGSGERELRELLRGALGANADAPDLTRGVQQKIRARSKGKFFADGWSTAKHPPRSTYLVTSLLMLFVLALIYALLSPLSGAPERALPPPPVHVLPPPP